MATPTETLPTKILALHGPEKEVNEILNQTQYRNLAVIGVTPEDETTPYGPDHADAMLEKLGEVLRLITNDKSSRVTEVHIVNLPLFYEGKPVTICPNSVEEYLPEEVCVVHPTDGSIQTEQGLRAYLELSVGLVPEEDPEDTITVTSGDEVPEGYGLDALGGNTLPPALSEMLEPSDEPELGFVLDQIPPSEASLPQFDDKLVRLELERLRKANRRLVEAIAFISLSE